MKFTSIKDLTSIFQNSDLQSSDIVLCHSSLVALGKMESGIKGIVDAFFNVIGERGTVVAPTFTYSAFNNEVFDHNLSKGVTGSLGNYISEMGVRSLDPNFSHAALGYNAIDLTLWKSGQRSFGGGSIYEHLLNYDALIFLLGVDFKSLPIFMHIEAVKKVDYRYEKKFFSQIKTKDEMMWVESKHFVRSEIMNPNTNRSHIGKIIASTSKAVSQKLNYGELISIRFSDLVKIVQNNMSANPQILLDATTPFNPI